MWPRAGGARCRRRGRRLSAELADAEEVGAVGDDDDVVEVVFAGDGGEAVDLLLGVDGVGLGDDVVEGNAVGEEVVAADAAFGVAGVLVAAAAEGDDEWARSACGRARRRGRGGRGGRARDGRRTRLRRRRRWRRRAGRCRAWRRR